MAGTPVSYTHLDVYKRQDVRCTNIQEQIVEIVNEKYDAKINDLDDRINKINETVINEVQNQLET